MITFSSLCSAQTKLSPEYHHFLQLTGSLSYSALLDNSRSVNTISGTSAALGVGWRLYHNRLLFSVAVEGNYAFFQPSMSEVKLSVDMLDTEGMPFTLVADASSGRDICNSFDVRMPLLLGGEFNRFVFLLGPVVSFGVAGKTSASAQLTTTGDYDRYIGVFENMPNHFFTTMPVTSQKRNFRFDTDVLIRAEIGWRLGELYSLTGADVPKPTKRGYISLFAEYGLLNVHSARAEGNRIAYSETESEGVKFYLTPALLSDEWRNVHLNRLTLGIRATLLLELRQRKNCVICRD